MADTNNDLTALTPHQWLNRFNEKLAKGEADVEEQELQLQAISAHIARLKQRQDERQKQLDALSH